MADEDGPAIEDADMVVDVWAERFDVLVYVIEDGAVDAMAAVTTIIEAVCCPDAVFDNVLWSLPCWAVFANFSKTSSKL